MHICTDVSLINSLAHLNEGFQQNSSPAAKKIKWNLITEYGITDNFFFCTLRPWLLNYLVQQDVVKQQHKTGTNSMELSPSWEPQVSQLHKNFPPLYGARRFITIFTRVLHWSLTWAGSSQSMPSHPISLRSYSKLSIRLRRCLPSGIFLLVFPPITYIRSSSSRATCTDHLIVLNLTILIIQSEEHKLWSSSLCSPLKPSVISSRFCPNILLSTLFSNTLNLCFHLMSETKFRTRTEPRLKWWPCVF
jgi:hypothetical protein